MSRVTPEGSIAVERAINAALDEMNPKPATGCVFAAMTKIMAEGLACSTDVLGAPQDVQTFLDAFERAFRRAHAVALGGPAGATQ